MADRHDRTGTRGDSLHMSGLAGDWRHALRQVVRRPAVNLVVILTLAVGIGPNVAIFSFVKALLLNPLPYPEPERLVQVWETDVNGNEPDTVPGRARPYSYLDFVDHREQSSCFEAFGTYTPGSFNLGGDGDPERVQGVKGTAGVLRAFAVQPAFGRLFTDDEVRNESRVVVLSDGLWRRRYEADPGILGRAILINGERYVVVGVMPPRFEQLTPWARASSLELWAPLVPSPNQLGPEGRKWHSLLAVGRLAHGVTREAAQAEMRSIAARLQSAYPDSNARIQVWLRPFEEQVVGRVTGELLVLFGGVGLVLLIAIANVASLLLARGTGRQRELAIRASLGASRARLATQTIIESLVLALLGGAVGVLLGSWCINLLKGTMPPEVPRVAGIALDNGVLLFSVAVTVLAGIACGLVPALSASHADPLTSLKEGSTTTTQGVARKKVLRRLAMAQLALAFMLTNGAMLLLSSYRNVIETPQVFDRDHVITAGIALAGTRYKDDHAKVDFWARLLERLEAMPGALGVGVTSKLPLDGGTNGWVLVDGQDYDPDVLGPLTEFSYVSPGYFEAMGIPLRAGRTMRWDEGTSRERVAVVNRAFVDAYWPGEDPIGRGFRENGEPAAWSAVVIGVVEDVRQWGPDRRPLPEAYFPYQVFPYYDSKLVVRAAGAPTALVPGIRRLVLDVDPLLPIANVQTMDDLLAVTTRGRRFNLLLVGLFAVVAVLLSTAGVFAIMSHNVAQRRRELSVRVAFGARWRDLVGLVMREALKLVLFGLAGGALLLFLTVRVIASQLYGLGSLTAAYVLASALIMLAVAVVAGAVPALRAARVDPNQVLRAE